MLREVLIKEGLSNRESEVAELVTQGLSNKEVATRLFVTEKTVKFHLTNIYKKMNVKSRAQLIVWCLPNMTFVERGGDSKSTENNNGYNAGIPSGHSPVSSQSEEEPKEAQTILPGSYNKNNF